MRVQELPTQALLVGSKISGLLLAPVPVRPPVPTPPFNSVKSPWIINGVGMVNRAGLAARREWNLS